MSNVTSTEPLVLTEQIAAPHEVVFDFLVDPVKLSRWMGEADIDPQPGGHFQLDVGENRAVGTYLRVDPPNSVAFTWGWEDHDTVPPGSTVVTISLRMIEDDLTEVELRHEGLPLGPADEHKGGWRRCLDSLPYQAAREVLRHSELELMRARERVAEQRRSLPDGPLVGNYEFTGTNESVTIAELFTDPAKPLVLYHFMFGGTHEAPCPMCAMWADGWNAVSAALSERLDFALVTSATPEQNAELAAERGWHDLRLLSAADTTFKSDIGGEDEHGNQMPFISVYEKTNDGVRLTYSGSAHISGDHWRGLDLLSPVWHLLDLTPQGRGDWLPSGTPRSA